MSRVQSQNKAFYCFFLQSLAATHTSRVNCDEMAGDRLEQFVIRNCYTGNDTYKAMN